MNLFDFVSKLWNRGVDIGVNVISALLVAGIIALFWKWKKQRELELERARLKIRQELATVEQSREQQKYVSKLSHAKAEFIERISAVKSGDELHSAWIAFGQWLNSSGLSNSGNSWIFEKWRAYNDFQRFQTLAMPLLLPSFWRSILNQSRYRAN